MLFKNVNDMIEKNEKKFFIEKINIINEMVHKYAISKNINININSIKIDEKIVFKELVKIGFIEKNEDLVLAKKILGSEYHRLYQSLTLYKQNSWSFLNKFYNSYRSKEQATNEKSNKPKIIDLFCGAGGFSLGFINEGYKVEIANDIEPVAIETYKFNHPDIHTSKILSGDIKEIVNNLDENLDIDVIIGGPPCQSFSSANQQRVIDDPRNILYTYYVKAVAKIQPKFILMENVRGMIKVADEVVEDFNKVGYDVEYKLFDSSEFSVAQKRVRLLYMGINRKYAKEQNLTPAQLMQEVEEALLENKKFVLKDALEEIKPLHCPTIKNMTEVDSDTSGKKIDINSYTSNKYLSLINNKRKQEFVFNHKSRYCNKINEEIYATLKQGGDATCESIKNIMPYSHRNHVFKDKYFKLYKDKPSKTITAHLKMDCHSHIHPTQTRSLTPRESARVQSFPDDYLFLGAYLKTYMQIGNAVPPLMSQVFAKVYKKYL